MAREDLAESIEGNVISLLCDHVIIKAVLSSRCVSRSIIWARQLICFVIRLWWMSAGLCEGRPGLASAGQHHSGVGQCSRHSAGGHTHGQGWSPPAAADQPDRHGCLPLRACCVDIPAMYAPQSNPAVVMRVTSGSFRRIQSDFVAIFAKGAIKQCVCASLIALLEMVRS